MGDALEFLFLFFCVCEILFIKQFKSWKNCSETRPITSNPIQNTELSPLYNFKIQNYLPF